MREEKKGIVFLVALLWLATLACGVPGFSDSEPTVTPASNGNFLTFSVPSPGYAVSLNPGDRVPGSRLEYIGQEGDAFRVRINGQESLKRIGDSFTWTGIIAPGVFGEYNLRLTTALLGPLPVAGGLTVTILDWMPIEITTLPDLSGALHLNNFIINYNVPIGETVPASNMVYDGIVTQGNTQFAQLSGISGNSRFAVGDSVVWMGTLRSNVYLRYNLRVISFDENNLHLGGTAEIWLNEATYP